VTQSDAWHRVHPLSPAVRAGRALIAIAIVFVPTFASGGSSGWDAGVHAAIAGALLVLGVVYWLVTRWRIEGGDLRIETGLLRRSSQRYPLSQVQAIDTVRPGLARIFGLAELRLRMGGTGGAARLAYLPVQQAEALRARLLALSRGAHADTPEPSEDHVLEVHTGRLVGSIVLSARTFVLVAYLLAFGIAAEAHSTVLTGLTRGAFVIVVGDVVAIWRVFNRGYRATIATAPEGLRVRAGLVETVAETIPQGRVQAVRLLEPILWRPFGWCRVDVDLAGEVRQHGDERRSGRQLRSVLPVGTRAEGERLLAILVPGAPAATDRPPRRARWKSPLRYRRLSFGYDEGYTVATTGRLIRVCTWVPLTKVQSLRRIEGPVQRALGIATLHLDTAGKNMGAALRDLDAGELRVHLDRLTELARAARHT
jgi:putative membrane protein